MNRVEISNFAEKLFKDRTKTTYRTPQRKEAHKFVDKILSVLFPHFSNYVYNSSDELEAELLLIKSALYKTLSPFCEKLDTDLNEKINLFFDKIPHIYDLLVEDAKAIVKGDPAAKSLDEVILTYPGFLATAIYRIAHEFYKMDVPIFPRLLTEYAHHLTGVDIHPGAKIGKRLCIDHATGIVVGETCLIGDNVKIYQGVTLGALSVDKDLVNKKRHPTIEDNVVIYSNATILGGETKIGKGSIIGGNVWLTESVEPNSVVYHKSEISLKSQQKEKDEPINFVI
jgi:serine O-acetyltransferase